MKSFRGCGCYMEGTLFESVRMFWASCRASPLVIIITGDDAVVSRGGSFHHHGNRMKNALKTVCGVWRGNVLARVGTRCGAQHFFSPSTEYLSLNATACYPPPPLNISEPLVANQITRFATR